jgi:hypothetical protein
MSTFGYVPAALTSTPPLSVSFFFNSISDTGLVRVNVLAGSDEPALFPQVGVSHGGFFFCVSVCECVCVCACVRACVFLPKIC